MKKLLFLAVLLGLTGCGESDQNDTSQSTLQSSPASFNYYKAASARTMSAPVASFGQWVVNGYASEGASTVLNANRIIGGVSTESKALITPNVSQVSKILRAGLGGAALTFAVNELLDGIDWVMDPENNSVKFKTEIEGIIQYKGLGDSLFDTAEEYCSWRLNKVKSEAYPDSSLRNITISSNGTYGTCWIYTYSPVYAVDFGFDIIKIKKTEEKTLPLDVVSQEIINNAQSGNTDAQAVTLAAAQAIVSEAENDATKAKEIEDELERNSEKCPNGESRNIYGQCWICPIGSRPTIRGRVVYAKEVVGGLKKCEKNMNSSQLLTRYAAYSELGKARDEENACWTPPHQNHILEAIEAKKVAAECNEYLGLLGQ
ncbi:hypothetical protein [Acinetobacter bereziniae]|uniref:Lipoprotein n=1 Tax=Acinetobacter bereziniae NIPH 3 TaxID=1217651 RepID=N8X938_ACIBZ|nr:hypothetical protein [Acinetobacter bereziniae]ENV20942.1 hypothetical protein F963_03073 [Acinetobacter bereziniae NIPH 3]